MSFTDTSLISAGSDLVKEHGSLAGVVMAIISTIFLMFANAAATFLSSLIEMFTIAMTMAAEGLGGFIQAIFAGAGTIMEVGGAFTAEALQKFDILAFPVGLAIVLISLWMIAQYRQEQETGDLLPGLPVDVGNIPLLGGVFGTREEDEEGAE